MTTDNFTALTEAYVLGALDPEEARQLAQHLATGCSECEQAVEEARRVVSLLPYTVSQKEPPADVKKRLLDAIAAEAKSPKLRLPSEKEKKDEAKTASIRAMPSRTFYQRIRGTLAWAAVFLLVAVTYGYLLQRNAIQRLRQHLVSLEQQIDESRSEIQQLKDELARQQIFMNRVKASNLLLVELKGLPLHPAGRVKIFLDPRKNMGSFFAYNLAPLAVEEDYQLWFIKDGKPFDAGVFHVDENGEYLGEVLHLPETLAGITAFAVTKEPKGGRPEPTLSSMYLLGEVQGG